MDKFRALATDSAEWKRSFSSHRHQPLTVELSPPDMPRTIIMHLIIRSLGRAGENLAGFLCWKPGNKTPTTARVLSQGRWRGEWFYATRYSIRGTSRIRCPCSHYRYWPLWLPLEWPQGECFVLGSDLNKGQCSGGSAAGKTSLVARFCPRSRSIAQGWAIKTKINLDFALCCFVQSPRSRPVFCARYVKGTWKELLVHRNVEEQEGGI